MRIIQENGEYLIIPESPEESDQINACLFVYRSGTIETKFLPGDRRTMIPVFLSAKDTQAFVDILFGFQQRIKARREKVRLAELDLHRLIDNSINYFKLQQAKKIYYMIIRQLSKCRLLQVYRKIHELVVKSAESFQQSQST